MQGIYKITNKKNGMSYIGQSIHCGKRLDEHCIGDQYIDKIMNDEGISNFTFEILKEVAISSQLSYWEDFYIHKFNTMYPNGYNKRLNTNLTYSKEQLESVSYETSENKEGTSYNEKEFYQKILKLNKIKNFDERILILFLYKDEPLSIQKIQFLLSKHKNNNRNKKRISDSIKMLYEENILNITNENLCNLTFEVDKLNFSSFFKEEKQILTMQEWESKLFLFSFLNNLMGYSVDYRKCCKYFKQKYQDYNKNRRFFKKVLLEIKCKYPFLEIKE